MAVLTTALSAQAPASPPAAQNPNFRLQVDLVTTDVLVRDDKGNFIADLKSEDFEIYEDGVLQDISSMTVFTGGRVTNLMVPPPAPPPEGVILPPARPRTSDVSGRIFVFFVDDQHLQFHNTGRVRELFQKISKELLHEGDMFGIVSSGPSSLSIQMTYDKNRLQDAIKKMTGNELKPQDIINTFFRARRSERGPVSRARRVFDRRGNAEESRAGAQPAQGADLRERRLRFHAVCRMPGSG